MVGRTTSEIGDTDFNYDENIIDEHNNKFAPDLSPVSDGSSERTNRVDDKYNIFSDNSSLLGVIVDRSSFDEDDELTTYGNSASIFHAHNRLNLPLHHHQDGDEDLPPLGGVVMKNGKVRRKMRWKPRFRKSKNSSNANSYSSNASVVSALTNRSSASTRSFLSHFSRKSHHTNTSFHTFHSTATPVATNKKNRPQAPHTVMRPNYQDSFDTKPSHTTIEGRMKQHRQQQQKQKQQQQKQRGSFVGFQSTKLDSVMESALSEDNVVAVSRSSTLESKTSIGNTTSSNHKTNSNTGIGAINVTSSNNSVGATSAISAMSKEENSVTSAKKPPIPLTIKGNPQQSKPRRPPLFKRRLRYSKNKSASSLNTATTNNNQVSSPTDTNSTASLSSAISLERENSGLPVLKGDEQDRRVQVKIDITRSLFTDYDEDNIVNNTTSQQEPLKAIEAGKTCEVPEENSVSPTVQSSVSGSQSGSGGSSNLSRNTTPVSLQKRISSITKKRSTSSTSISTASPKRNIGAAAAASATPSPNGRGKNRTKNSVPCDLDEGAFLEAEHNLRAIHEMAAEHLAHGEYEEAADVFEEILRGQQERYGQDHYRVGTALHNLGIVYLKKGDCTKAIEICQRAVDVRKDSLVPNHPDVAVSLSQLGVAHLESKNYHQALDAFGDALKIRRTFLGPKHMKCSKILNNIGCALYSIEDLAGAKRSFDEALEIQRQGLRSLPMEESKDGMQSNTLLLSMASTLCNIGSIRLRWGDFERAEIDLEEALLIQQSVLGDEHPIVSSTIDSIELVETAKHCAQNPQSYNAFLMKTAAAACTVGESPTHVMTEILGMSNFEEGDWFVNPCAPVSYNPRDHD